MNSKRLIGILAAASLLALSSFVFMKARSRKRADRAKL